MVCTVPHTHTNRSTITDRDVADAVRACRLPDDWDVVERRRARSTGRWFWRRTEQVVEYELLVPVAGVFPWQLITAAHDKATLLAWLYGYHSGLRDGPQVEEKP